MVGKTLIGRQSTAGDAAAKVVAVWLDEQQIYLGFQEMDSTKLRVVYARWNSRATSSSTLLQSTNELAELAACLQSLARTYSLTRHTFRLCLSDSLCVTRVATGEQADVERELEEVQDRSQLYLSLGLGEKLTGSIRENRIDQPLYALTSIANTRCLQTIHDAFQNARLRIESVEPVSLSITRAFDALGLDAHEPVLLASVEGNRCDLAISRSGRLMLSYPIKGARDVASIAQQISSHITRLKRFSQRYRELGDDALQTLYILGKSEGELRACMETLGQPLKMPRTGLPQGLEFVCDAQVPHAVKLALWAGRLWHRDNPRWLQPPDLWDRLLARQARPWAVRAWEAFWPSVGVSSLLLTFCGLRWADLNHLRTHSEMLASRIMQGAGAERELKHWRERQTLLNEYKRLELDSIAPNWSELLSKIAPCMPDNARLDSIIQRSGEIIELRGTIVERDSSYELVSALKQLELISDISIESLHSDTGSQSQHLTFEMQVKLHPAHFKKLPHSLIGSDRAQQIPAAATLDASDAVDPTAMLATESMP